MPTPSFYLKSLTLRAFRSVVDEQTIALPRTGMHLLLGPSGAGKTTVGEAIAFALGYSNFSAIDLQSWDWLTDLPLRDTLELETAKGTLRITRGKGANIHLPGEAKPRTSAKAVKECLAQALGLDPEQFLAPLTYRSQKTPGLFLSMTDSDKKSFLTQLLGLEVFERAADKAVSNISALATEVERLKTRHSTLLSTIPIEPVPPTLIDLAPLGAKVVEVQTQYEQMGQAFTQTKELDSQLWEHHTQRVNIEKAKWKPILTDLVTAHDCVPKPDTSILKIQLDEITHSQVTLCSKHQDEIRVVEKELETTVRMRDALAVLANKKTEAEAKLLHIEADYNQISSDKCFTCLRDWPDDPNKRSALKACWNDIEAQKEIIDTASKAFDQLAVFDTSIAELRQTIKGMKEFNPVSKNLLDEERSLRATIANAKSEYEAAVARTEADYHRMFSEAQTAIHLSETMTPEEEQVRRTLGDLQNALTGLSHQVTQAKQGMQSAKRLNEQAQQYYDQAVAQRLAVLDTVGKATIALDLANTNLTQEQDFLGMVRGFLSYIFDETLGRIADATNARLALIPNVSDIAIHFISEHETGSGKLRQEITPVCEKNGHTIPLKAGVSGGMYTAVELAVDLSLADVIAERTGVFPGWLILDEAFDGLDAECKQACFDLLKESSKDRAIFVVDHATEMKEMFDSRLTIEISAGKTKLCYIT